MTGCPRYAVVIPAYNEERTIYDVVARTLRYVSCVFVVDDGSTDGTADALRGLPITVLHHSGNLGKAAALLLGMQHALDHDATAIITLDGDGQHEPEDIPALMARHCRTPQGMIIGSRLHNSMVIPLSRYVANRIANFWISWAAGQRIVDTQSGFRLYPASVLHSLILLGEWTAGFVFESEVLIEAGRKAIPIRSIPVSSVYGRHLRRSHFMKLRDISRITRMVAKKLMVRRLDLPALLHSRRPPVQRLDSLISYRRDQRSKEPRRRRLLVLAEAVSLAHVARAVTLAQSLDRTRYEVRLACDPRYMSLFDQLGFPVHTIASIGSSTFQDRLARGAPLYTMTDLRQYVREDLRIMMEWEPELVVGDFRLSLSVSARLFGIPYATVTNAHWSPYAHPRYLVPELSITRRFGPRVAQGLFNLIRPFVFAKHAEPLNMVRREYGLPAVGSTLAHIFSEADCTLYADLPQLVPTADPPPHHHYIGPVVWSFGRRPWWWSLLRDDARTAYVTMGSSGMADLSGMITQSLADLGWQVLTATAGREAVTGANGSVWTAKYLPGTAAACRADLVVCNGGSAAVYQALTAGTPVLGIPVNLDQYVMMDYVQRAEAGDYIRAGAATAELVARSAGRIVESTGYKTRAVQLRDQIFDFRTGERFQSCVDDLLRSGPATSMEPLGRHLPVRDR